MYRANPRYLHSCCLLLCLCLVPLHGVWAQPYEERLQFLRDKLAEVAQVESRAIAAQMTLSQSRRKRNALLREKWQQLERRSRQTRQRLEAIIRQLEAHVLDKAIKRYAQEDTSNMRVDSSLPLWRLDGRKERLHSYKGQVILLHFWATWCKPCLEELPSLKSFYERFASHRFEILAISLDARRKDINRFLRGKGIRFPIFFDPGRFVYHKIVSGLEVLPHSILIDKRGKVFKSYVGEQRWEHPAILDDIAVLLSAP